MSKTDNIIFSNYYFTLAFINIIPKLQHKNNIKNCKLKFTFYKFWKSLTIFTFNLVTHF